MPIYTGGCSSHARTVGSREPLDARSVGVERRGDARDTLGIGRPVDIDSNPMSPTNYAVRGIPTLILFKDGKVASTQVGALPKSRLKDWISSQI